MDLKTLYNMKPKFVARAVGNEMILVPLSGNVAQMNELFTMNETARFIWENTNESTTLADLETLMTEEFDIDSKTAKEDIEKFLAHLESTLKH
jgi:hypothetical protein